MVIQRFEALPASKYGIRIDLDQVTPYLGNGVPSAPFYLPAELTQKLRGEVGSVGPFYGIGVRVEIDVPEKIEVFQRLEYFAIQFL